MDWRERCAVAASGRRTSRGGAWAEHNPCRRNAGTDAHPRREEDPSRLCLGLRHQPVHGAVPIDNNWAENQIRPWALGRKNWLFAGSLRSGKRAAVIMSLIQSARLNGHDPYDYLKDVLTRLPTQRASEIMELLPYRWVLAQ